MSSINCENCPILPCGHRPKLTTCLKRVNKSITPPIKLDFFNKIIGPGPENDYFLPNQEVGSLIPTLNELANGTGETPPGVLSVKKLHPALNKDDGSEFLVKMSIDGDVRSFIVGDSHVVEM